MIIKKKSNNKNKNKLNTSTKKVIQNNKKINFGGHSSVKKWMVRKGWLIFILIRLIIILLEQLVLNLGKYL